MKWTKVKPKLAKGCLIIAGTQYNKYWDYSIFEIKKTTFEDKWYWGIFTGCGDEWGDYSDLKADLYYVIPKNK